MAMSTTFIGVLALAAALASGQDVRVQRVRSQNVRIGVLGLFRPKEFTLTASNGSALILHCNQRSFSLERSSGVDRARIHLENNSIVIEIGTQLIRAPQLTLTSRENGATDFVLSIPGKITRHYHGMLEVAPASGSLRAVVTMDMETAVASVVAAESQPGAAFEALKAQAVAARSYFAAGNNSHHGLDFCDTTHCQFLREPPSPETPAAKATAATRGLVLAYHSQPFAAMYTRSCSGHTRTLAELRLPAATYPYYSADCKYCREHPARWQSQIAAADAAVLRSSDESARLKTVRRLGWSAVPSNDFTMEKQGEQIFLQGSGQGHGLGLCQAGANAMALSGTDFRQILGHYYPNTEIISLDNNGGVQRDFLRVP